MSRNIYSVNNRIPTINNKPLYYNDGLFVGGAFTAFNGKTASRITYLDRNGFTNEYFKSGTGFNNTVNSIIDVNDGIIVGGTFTSYNGTPCNRIVKLKYTGEIDSSFNIGSGFNNTAPSLATVICIKEYKGKI